MKKSKITIVFLLIFSLIFTSCISVQATAAGNKKYTVLVYMVGSDLESGGGFASTDLKEMMSVGSDASMNVIVQTGGSSKWSLKEISSKSNQRWIVQKGKINKLADIGNKDMGDPATLSDFITWAIKTYPADKYGIVFWDHGGGTLGGYGWDEVNENMLSLSGLNSALKKSKEASKAKFEFIGFDACLMATLENANIMKNYGNYLVASEELEPGHGWDYSKVFGAIKANPSITGDKLGIKIADGFKQQAIAQETVDEITLSVTNLSKIDPVVKALEGLTENIKPDMKPGTKLNSFASARSKSTAYGESTEGSTDMVDLGDLTSNAIKNNKAYEANGKKLIDALKGAVVYSVAGKLKSESKGLSVYMPHSNMQDYKDKLQQYASVGFSPKYSDFIKKYADSKSGVSESVTFEDMKPVEEEEAAPEEETQPEEETETESLYEVVIPKDKIDYVDRVYSVLAMINEEDPDETIYLGMDSDVTFDTSTGKVTDNFTGEWVTFDGHFVSMYLDDETEDYAEYSIPAKLNGERVDIILYIDYKTGEYEFVGAWKGIDEESGMADKDIIKLEYGDKIAPVYEYYNEKTEEEGFWEGDEFTYTEKSELYIEDLPSGNYLYGFYIEDIFGDGEATDMVELNLE